MNDNPKAALQVAEFAALVDALPQQFREPILLAALLPGPQHMSSEPFIVGLRSRFVTCVLESTGRSLPENRPCDPGCIAIRETVAMFGRSTALAWTEQLVRKLIHTATADAPLVARVSRK